MKKEHYYFDMPQETYNYIMRLGILRESKKEKTILDLCLLGKSIKEISYQTGYSVIKGIVKDIKDIKPIISHDIKEFNIDKQINIEIINEIKEQKSNLDFNNEYNNLYKHYTPEEYPRFENFDAINVNATTDIPCDFDGIMGVPITFLDKYIF